MLPPHVRPTCLTSYNQQRSGQNAGIGGRAIAGIGKPLVLREPLTVNLYEVLQPAPAGAAGATYALFTRAYPAVGKAADLLALAQAEVTAQQTDGIAVTLSRSAISPEGQFYVAAYALADLPALEGLLQGLAASPRWQTFIGQVPALLRLPLQTVLEEVLIPFPG